MVFRGREGGPRITVERSNIASDAAFFLSAPGSSNRSRRSSRAPSWITSPQRSSAARANLFPLLRFPGKRVTFQRTIPGSDTRRTGPPRTPTLDSVRQGCCAPVTDARVDMCRQNPARRIAVETVSTLPDGTAITRMPELFSRADGLVVSPRRVDPDRCPRGLHACFDVAPRTSVASRSNVCLIEDRPRNPIIQSLRRKSGPRLSSTSHYSPEPPLRNNQLQKSAAS